MARRCEGQRWAGLGRRGEMRGSFWGGLRSGGEKVNAKSRTKESELHIPPSAATERVWQVTGDQDETWPQSLSLLGVALEPRGRLELAKPQV